MTGASVYSQKRPNTLNPVNSVDVSENIRLKNRHIDLRRPGLKKNILTRHKASTAVRNYLNANNFVDIDIVGI